jgi:hypothetical protein
MYLFLSFPSNLPKLHRVAEITILGIVGSRYLGYTGTLLQLTKTFTFIPETSDTGIFSNIYRDGHVLKIAKFDFLLNFFFFKVAFMLADVVNKHPRKKTGNLP